MKYVFGSLIISFGVMLVLMVILNAMGLKSPSDSLATFGLVWGGLALLCYPVARKIVR